MDLRWRVSWHGNKGWCGDVCWRGGWLAWCGSGVMTWRMTWAQEVNVAANVAALINFASTLFFCAAIALLSFLCCYCWRRGVIAEGEDSCSLLKVVVAVGRFYCFVCGWWLRATTLGAVADEDLLMARRGWHWLRLCHRWGFTAAGVGDLLWLLKAMADEDLLCCLYCGEPPVGAGCDGFVGGCCWWFCAVEVRDPLMSLAMSIWWLPLVCVGGSKSAWIGGLMCRSSRWWVYRCDWLRRRCDWLRRRRW